MFYRLIVALLVGTCLCCTKGSNAAQWLNVGIGGIGGSDCKGEPRDAIVAGSQCEIVIEVIGRYFDTSTRPWLPSGPPSNLRLTATAGGAEADLLSGSSRLRSWLNPQFFVSDMQAMEATIPRGPDTAGQDGFLRPAYHFLITLPENLAGQRLCITAAFDDSLAGHFEGSSCQKIVAPCSQWDRSKVLDSYIMLAYQSQNFERAMALADSLVKTGWRSRFGLDNAGMAAHQLKLYDRELEYLDLEYRTFGRIGFIGRGPTFSQRDAEEYQRIRSDIIQRRDQQQQR